MKNPKAFYILMTIIILAGLLNICPSVTAAPGDTTRVSVTSDGSQSNGYSGYPSISADGRFVAFRSLASNLVPGDTNDTYDTLVHDRKTGETSCISVASDGTKGNDASEIPSISADGRFVAFESEASNLVSVDTNEIIDIFLHDRLTGETDLVSVASDGTQGNNASERPSISADGRYVAFSSWASNLVPDDTNDTRDIFVHDLQTEETVRVSVSSDDIQGDEASGFPSISADGRFVTFYSDATTLVNGDTNGWRDTFVHDLQTGETTRVSVKADGSQGNIIYGYSTIYFWGSPKISADGRYVAFSSYLDNLVPMDYNFRYDVFLKDRQTGEITLVSKASDGTQGNDNSLYISISDDGRYVTFDSMADNLVPGDTNDTNDVFLHDIQTGETNIVSVASDSTQGNGYSGSPSISGDGLYVTFSTSSDNLVPGDTNGETDVFVREYEGDNINADDLEIDLRIDDAPDMIIVNKSNGSYVDIVAKIQAGEAYDPNVTLEVPSDLLGAPVKTFTRNFANNNGYGQEDEFADLGDGKYNITTALSRLSFRTMYYKEIVWRFQIPESLLPQTLQPIVNVTWEDKIVATDTVKLRIVDWANTIAVTNRERLFDESNDSYGHDVVDLLEETYKILDDKNGELFYIDCYNINWNSNDSDEISANLIVEQIDNKVEEWYMQLTKSYLKPKYLVIIGDDEIVPFYRMDDNNFSPCWLGTCEKDGWGSGSDKGYPWTIYHNNYFLSDNIYADIGGGNVSWENGDLELAMGRIVGKDPNDMQNFLRNSHSRLSPLSEALVASQQYLDVYQIINSLKEKNAVIHSETNPDLTNNDNWTKAQFLSAWETNSQLYAHMGHTNPKVLTAKGGDEIIYTTDLPQANIKINKPLLLSLGCNLGVPVEDGMVNKFIEQGFSGIVASTGLAKANYVIGLIGYGEKIVNNYVDELIFNNGDNSKGFGDALLKAKQNYNPTSGLGKKAVLEYVYYGLPWSYMRTPENTREFNKDEIVNKDFGVSETVPIIISLNSYSTDINFSVNNYSIAEIDDYDLLFIEDTELLSGEEELPGLPYKTYTLMLPLGSAIEDISILNENAMSLGEQNIPMVIPLSTYEEGNGLEPFTGTGFYPTHRLSYQVVEFPDYTAVELTLVLAEYDGSTNELTLFDTTDIQVNYNTPQSTFIRDFEIAKPEFEGNESITGTATIENVSATDVNLTGVVEIFKNDISQSTISIPSFVVTAGESYELPVMWPSTLPQGTYTSVLYIYESENLISGLQDDFSISKGKITSFIVPEIARTYAYSEISLSFSNYSDTSANLVAEVLINQNGIEVSKLLQKELVVGAFSEGIVEWDWNPESLGPGEYEFKAVVHVGDDYFHTGQHTLRVLPDIYLPFITN